MGPARSTNGPGTSRAGPGIARFQRITGVPQPRRPVPFIVRRRLEAPLQLSGHRVGRQDRAGAQIVTGSPGPLPAASAMRTISASSREPRSRERMRGGERGIRQRHGDGSQVVQVELGVDGGCRNGLVSEALAPTRGANGGARPRNTRRLGDSGLGPEVVRQDRPDFWAHG